jgi:flotillin
MKVVDKEMIDKITVWDSVAKGDDGNGSTANFISGLMKTVPPLNDLFNLNMAGLNPLTYLKDADESRESNDEEKKDERE